MKFDIANIFYRTDIAIEDMLKLAVVFSTINGIELLVTLPLVLPIGWKNSLPIFNSATEIGADVTNEYTKFFLLPRSLNKRARRQDETTPQALSSSEISTVISSTTSPTPVTTYHNIYLSLLIQDLSLPTGQDLLQSIDIFIDDFIALCQGNVSKQVVRTALFHAIDTVFYPNDYYNSMHRQEPASLSKFKKVTNIFHKLIQFWDG